MAQHAKYYRVGQAYISRKFFCIGRKCHLDILGKGKNKVSRQKPKHLKTYKSKQ